MTTPVPPTVPADSCSLPVDENLPGTAARESLWVLLEHPGGWGRDILDGTTFGPELSAALKEKMAQVGGRLLLIRHPGREGQKAKDAGARRRAFVAVTGGRADTIARLYSFEVTGAEDLLTLPLETPEKIPGAVVSRETLTLICTHSKRDRCCAVRGRPIASFVAEQLADGSVWECSHTGGHRFAPVAISLPTGYTYGRLNFEQALALAQEAQAGQVELTGLRGRSSHSPMEQVAEVAVRTLLADVGERPGPDDLNPGEMAATEPDLYAAHVAHRDGRFWVATARRTELAPRPASCGKDAGPAFSWEVVSLVQGTA
ncbi:sucrase ferredoxin [Rothia nasimurium]|uniref:sucrase ferredoxin n=1 Tax=Rothia nasimurium TaxID=85336 RepID=UPI001F21C159|nr:sucrase ferredoxin [Rothia nasimurium]